MRWNTYHGEGVSPVFWAIDVHHIPEFELSLDIEGSVEVVLRDIDFSTEMGDLADIGLCVRVG